MSSAGVKAKNSGALQLRKDLHAYTLAVSGVLLVAAIEAALAPIVTVTVLLPLSAVAIAVAARVGGFGPGLLATLTAAGGTLLLTQYSTKPIDSGSQSLEATLLTAVAGIAVTLVIGASDLRSKHAQDSQSAFRETADRLSTAITAAHLDFWEIDLVQTSITQSEDLIGLLESATVHGARPTDVRDRRIPPEDRARVANTLACSLISRNPFECEYRVVTPDAKISWISCRGTVLEKTTDRPVAIVGISQDVTAARNSLEEARQTAQCLRAVFDCRGAALAQLDSEGRIQDVSERFCALSGFSAAELTGRPFHELLSGGVEQAPPGETPCAAPASESRSADAQFARQDGSLLWVSYTVATVPGGAIAVIEDISEQKQTEAKLRIGDHQLQAVIDAVPFALALVDATGRALISNDAHRRIWGRSQHDGERPPAPARGWFHDTGCRIAKEQWPLARALTGRVVIDELITLETEDGQRSTISSSAAPVIDHRGRICGAVAVDRDISVWHLPDCAVCDTTEQLRLVQAADALGLFKWDSTSKTVTWSDPLPALGVDLTDQPRTAEDWETLIHPEDVARVRSVLQNATVDQRVVSAEFRIVPRGGSMRWINVTATLLRNGYGRVGKIVGIARDATNVKREQRDFHVLAALLDSSDDAIIGETISGVIQSWSRGAEEIFGYSADEIIGRPVTILGAEADAEETLDLLKRVAAGERVKNIERMGYRSDGQQIWLSVTLCPIRNEAGEVVGISEVARNISAGKLSEKRIQALNRDLERRVRARTAQLEDANRMLESFVYSASHDLRAPLRTIQVLTQALVEDCADMLDENGKEYARRIIEGTARMDVLIRDLLEYSRLTRRELKVSGLPLPAAVSDALHEQAVAIAETTAEIVMDVDDVQVLAHRVTLVQVLSNLISNAIKFVPPGVCPIVRINAEVRGRRVRVYVQDNGIGIDPKHQGRIFDVFERLHSATEYPGTGIGLAIVKKGIQRLGGTVGVESSPGNGSRFWFELPLATLEKEGE